MKYLFLLAVLCAITFSCQKKFPSPKENVVINEWIVAADGSVSARWTYPDGRIAGTDFTNAEEIPALIEQFRYAPACSQCMRITTEPCWRH